LRGFDNAANRCKNGPRLEATFLPFYCVIVHGDGIRIRHCTNAAAALGLAVLPPEDDHFIVGFFTTRFVHSQDSSAAETKAMRFVADDWAAPPLSAINEGSAPQLSVDSTREIGLLEYLSRRPRGHTFYGDGEGDSDFG
jgi:hypothetical protein